MERLLQRAEKMASQTLDLKTSGRNLLIFTIIAIVAVNSVVLFAPDIESRNYYGDILGPITASFAVAYGLIIVRRQGFSGMFGRAYAALALGLALWLIAEVLWAYYTIGLQIEVPFPSLADAFWLAGYAPLGYHLLVMAKFYGRIKKQNLIIVTVATAIFAAAYISNIIESSALSESFLPLAISVAYPLLDAVLIIPVVLVLLTPTRGKLTSIPWIFISWLLTASADAIFGHTIVSNLAAEITVWNLLYNAAYICMASGLYWYNRHFIFDEKKLTSKWLIANK